MYKLGEDSINGIKIDDEIFMNEQSDWKITHRESFLDELIGWIGDSMRADRSDSRLMKDDLFELATWKDEYIFSNITTNDYVGEDDSRFNEICEELLKFNDTMTIDYLDDKYVEITLTVLVKYNANELDIKEVVDATTICFHIEDRHNIELFVPSTDDMEVIEYMEESFIDVTEQILKNIKLNENR
jgi:hypothetical protein